MYVLKSAFVALNQTRLWIGKLSSGVSHTFHMLTIHPNVVEKLLKLLNKKEFKIINDKAEDIDKCKNK